MYVLRRVFVSMYVCMYVCMHKHVCMYVEHVCMYSTYIHTCYVCNIHTYMLRRYHDIHAQHTWESMLNPLGAEHHLPVQKIKFRPGSLECFKTIVETQVWTHFLVQAGYPDFWAPIVKNIRVFVHPMQKTLTGRGVLNIHTYIHTYIHALPGTGFSKASIGEGFGLIAKLVLCMPIRHVCMPR